MIAFEKLAALALGELSEHEAHEVEDHVIGCSSCAETLERLLDLGDGVRAVTGAGCAFLLVSRALIAGLAREGKITREYSVRPGGRVDCTVDERDVYTAMRLELDARGARRIDFVYDAPTGSYRAEDIPFDPIATELVFVQPAVYLRTLPSALKKLRLVAVDESGERTLGEYTLNHTAYVPPSR
jgi:hypothetical protein